MPRENAATKATPAPRPVTAKPQRRFHSINDLLGDFGDAPPEPWEHTIEAVHYADRRKRPRKARKRTEEPER